MGVNMLKTFIVNLGIYIGFAALCLGAVGVIILLIYGIYLFMQYLGTFLPPWEVGVIMFCILLFIVCIGCALAETLKEKG